MATRHSPILRTSLNQCFNMATIQDRRSRANWDRGGISFRGRLLTPMNRLKMPPVGCQVYTSSPLLVQPGDTIQGDLYELEQQINIGGTWYCYPNNTVVEVQDLTPPDVEYAWIIEPWANWQTAQSGVLEAYGTPPQCSDFPPSNSISFTQPTNMYENGPPWLCGATNANQGPWTTLSGGSPPDAWATLISTCSISPTVGPSGNATLQWTY